MVKLGEAASEALTMQNDQPVASNFRLADKPWKKVLLQRFLK